MWEHFIEYLGFNNIYQGGQITGFQFMIHIPYYRGVFISCISDDFMVKVDDVNYTLDNVSIKIGDRVIPWSKIDASYDIFWPFGQKATVIVNKAGGLTPGLHKVECGFTVRKSYGTVYDPLQAQVGRGNLPKTVEEYDWKNNKQSSLQTCSEMLTLVM